MTMYLVAEHDNQQLDPTFHHLLGAALRLDKQPIVLVLGHQCAAVAAEVAALSGVAGVQIVDDPAFKYPLAEQFCPVVAQLATSCSYLLMASTTFGKNTLPRIAALLQVGQVSDVIQIVNQDTVERPIYAGNVIETVQLLDNQKVMSIRTAVFAAVKESQPPCEIKTVTVTMPSTHTHVVRREVSPSERPELSNAKIVVSGGRGLQSMAQFKLVESLADTLGAALGASRAAVDAGFISNDHQVGQTGKIVAPNLYIAVGISGAIQHIAGIKDAKVIVAINKDAAAPIFQVANYGLVGDLFELVPQIILELKQRGLHKC